MKPSLLRVARPGTCRLRRVSLRRRGHRPSPSGTERGTAIAGRTKFARDSSLGGEGFEPSVTREGKYATRLRLTCGGGPKRPNSNANRKPLKLHRPLAPWNGKPSRKNRGEPRRLLRRGLYAMSSAAPRSWHDN